jgi:hypothetical protein
MRAETRQVQAEGWNHYIERAYDLVSREVHAGGSQSTPAEASRLLSRRGGERTPPYAQRISTT